MRPTFHLVIRAPLLTWPSITLLADTQMVCFCMCIHCCIHMMNSWLQIYARYMQDHCDILQTHTHTPFER